MSISRAIQTGLSDRYIKEILSFSKRFNEIEGITLFGSRAKGTYKSGSDIDIAVLGETVSYSTICELSYLLNEESTLPYYFDVLHFQEITSPALLAHIEEYGIALIDTVSL